MTTQDPRPRDRMERAGEEVVEGAANLRPERVANARASACRPFARQDV